MKIRTRRRLLLAILVLLVFGALVQLTREYDAQTFRGHFFSGWLLLGGVAFLLLFPVRKRLSMLPLGRVYVWAQLHNCVGVLASLLLFVHIDQWWPSGAFERLLLVAALLTLMSGLLGIVVNRVLPPLMRKRGERIFMSRIRTHQSLLRDAVQQRVAETVEAGGSRYFLDFYEQRVLGQLLGIRDIPRHAIASSAPYQQWQETFDEAGQYISSRDREAMDEIRALLFQKMDLDFQYVMQFILRSWVIFHVGVGYLLGLLALIHLVLVYGFGGA